MRRTASSTICFQERSSRFGTGRDMMKTSCCEDADLAARQIEREHQVVDAVGGADLVAHVDEDPLRRVGVGHGLDLDVADAVLVLGERFFDVVADQRLRRGVVGGEDEVVDAAAPLGAHLPLASAVPMMMRTDSSILLSYLLSWMPPLGPTEKGNLKPTPRKLLMLPARSRCLSRLCGRDPYFHHSFAVGAGDDRAALPFFHGQPVGRIALGTDESVGAPRVDRLDDLVPDGLERGQTIFGMLIHVGWPPFDVPRPSQLDAACLPNTLSGGREISHGRGFDQEGGGAGLRPRASGLRPRASGRSLPRVPRGTSIEV